MADTLVLLRLASGLAFLSLGLLALTEWRRSRERGQLLIATAVGLLGMVSLLGRIGHPDGWMGRAVSDLSIAGLLGSSVALLAFRDTVVPLGRRWRIGVYRAAGVLTFLSLFVRWPGDRSVALHGVELVIALMVFAFWLGAIIEPALRFARVARSRPAVERARLRLLSAGYLGMFVLILLALANRGGEGTSYSVVLAAGGLLLVPLLYGALVPPAWLRGRWIEEQVARDRTRLLLTLPAVVWTTDQQLRMTSAHGAGIELFVATEHGYVGRALEEIHREIGILGTHSSDLTIAMHQRALEGETITEDVRAGDVIMQCRVEPINGPDGGIAGVMGFGVDISERKRAEDATRAAFEREHEAAEHLRSLDDMKNAFMNAVSHELRTPLAGVVGFAATLQQQRLAEEDRAVVLDRLIANANKLEGLLTDLLDLDRLSRGILEPRRKPTDVGSLARHVVDEWRSDAGRQVHLDTGEVIADVDGPKVERIVENLLANAAKYTPQGTPIWVSVARVQEGVTITVEDAGPGIPAPLRDAMLEPFQRGPGHIGHQPGFGIGLSLVSRFATLHGGSVTIGEREGGGASFRVFLASPAAERRRSGRPWREQSIGEGGQPTATPATR